MKHLARTVLTFIFLFLISAAGAEESDTIVISADRVEQETGAGQKTVISRDEIERLGARTVAEAINQSPGVNIIRSGSSLEPATVSIRGSGGQQVLVMVNGVPLNNSQGDAVNLNSISLKDVEAIEVIRGGYSAVYGEGAFGGVINIIRRDDSVPVPEGDISASYGSFNTFSGGGWVRGPLTRNGSLSGHLSADARSTDGEYDYPDSGGTLTRLNADGWMAQGAGGLRWNIGGMNQNVLVFDLGGYGSKRGVPGLMEFLTPEAEMQESRILSSLGWAYQSYSGFSLDTEISYINQYSAYQNPETSLDEDHRNRSIRTRMDATDSFEFMNFTLLPLAGFTFSFDGLESSGLKSSSGTVLPGQAEQWRSSLYSRIEARFNKFYLLPAVRWDWNFTEYVGWSTQTDDKLTWSVSAGYEPWDSGILGLKGNVGTAYHAPGFNDLFWSGGSFASGNPDLKPEESFNWDAGASITPYDGLNANIVYFNSQAENLIQWVATPGGTWKPVNIGETAIQGLECDLTWLIPLVKKSSMFLELFGSYTWMSAKNVTTGSINQGNQLPYRPENSGMGGLSYIWGGQSLTFTSRYIGYRFTNAANTKYFDPVLTFDSVLKIAFPCGFYTSAAVINITDIYYPDKLGYPVPGREWTITGGFQF